MRDNLVVPQSTGKRTSNFLPVPPHDLDYEFQRIPLRPGEAPISQLEFHNMYRACPRLCCWWFRLTHCCNGPTNNYSPGSIYRRPTNDSLKLIPKRKSKWDLYANYRGEAWGLTASELPSFLGFLAYFFLSAIGPGVFYGLWLSIWNHKSDLQNAVIPIALVLSLWTLLWQCATGRWNSNREFD
jgi:hypothetical protein